MTPQIPKSGARPELTTDELITLDRRHLIRSIHRGHIDERVVIVRGQGCRVWDSDGTELLDVAGGGVWHSPIGHGRADIAEAAAEQMRRMEYFTSLLEFTNDQAIRLAARLAELAPEGLSRVFFSGSGSEAVDTAVKAARLYHHRSGEPDRTWVLARLYSFHGASYGSGTLTGLDPMHEGVGPNLPHVDRLRPPLPYRADDLAPGENLTDALVAELERTIERIGAGNIAAMIGEPVMAAAGVHAPPPDYWPRVTEVLKANGILLIADEVVTAFGRLGSWFEAPRRGMVPDLITTAKGIAGGYAPLGATLMTDEIAEVLIGDGRCFFHGYTFQGHPVACATALATLDVIERENLLERAMDIERWLTDGLAEATALPVVGDVRVAGSLGAIELVTDKAARTPFGHEETERIAFEIRRRHGIIIRPYANMIVFAPPLVIGEHELRRAMSATLDVLSRVAVDQSLRAA